MPFIELRRYCLFVRSAAAGTPTTARTFEPCTLPLALTPTRRSRCLSSSRTASTSFSEPSLSRPRSSGRWRSSMVRFATASWPMRTSRLRTFRATMSAGQPTKLSTTKRSPFDAEIALREVPRSMPTCSSSSAISTPFLRRVARAGVGVDPVEQRLGDLLPVLRAAEHGRLTLVRKTADLGQHRRHAGGDEDDERRALDAPVLQPRIDAAQAAEELLLQRRGEAVGLVAADVGVDAVEELAQVGHRIAGRSVLVGGEARERRIVRWAEVVGLDPVLGLVRGERVH